MKIRWRRFILSHSLSPAAIKLLILPGRRLHAGKNTTHSVNTCKHLLDIIRYSVNINKHLLDEEDSFSLPRGDQTADSTLPPTEIHDKDDKDAGDPWIHFQGKIGKI